MRWPPGGARPSRHRRSRAVGKPLHLQPVFKGCDGEINGAAEALFDRGWTLPSGSGMTEEEFQRIERVIQGVVN